MGPVEVVEVFPLLQLVVEQVGVVNDDAVEHPVELFLVDAVGSLHFAVESWGCGFDVDVSDPPVEYVVVELGSELATVVGLDHLHLKRKSGQQVVEELDGGLLIAPRVNLEDT